MSGKFGFSWSWKRAIGLTSAKSRISREIGIPLTKSGRERKLGAWLLGDTKHHATAPLRPPTHRRTSHAPLVGAMILRTPALYVSTPAAGKTADPPADANRAVQSSTNDAR